jgi:hypothetical protein
MIDIISLNETPTNQTPLNNVETTEISNNNFLNILLSNLSETESSTPTNNIIMENPIEPDTETKTISLADLLTLTDENQNNLSSNETITSDLNLNELKNIIKSKVNQENILLSESDLKELKDITSLKELVNFANKKGLNIESIKVEVPNTIKNQTEQTSSKKESVTSTLIKEKSVVSTIQTTTQTSEEPETKVDLASILSNTNKKSNKETTNTEIKDNLTKTNTDKTTVETPKNSDKSLKVDNKVEVDTIKTSTETTKTDKINTEIKNNLETKKDVLTATQTNIKQNVVSLDTLINGNNEKTESKTSKTETIENSTTLNSSVTSNDIKLKTIFAKDTLKQFSSNLQEAIKEYKPPISKLSMELNPENLGKVDVTLVKKGNELQVTLNSSNQTTMQLFAQNQAEFRANLASIGFSNIDMSFNSNRDSNERNREKYKQNQNSNNEDEEISEIEIKGILKYA